MIKILIRVCMDCKKTLGFKFCWGTSLGVMKTHGLCKPCLNLRLHNLEMQNHTLALK